MKNLNGLSQREVNERINQGKVNNNELHKTKSYKQIFKDNTLTLFNGINIVLALLVLTTGSFRNLLFMLVIISNMLIGIVQEIRSKRTLDKIALIVASKAHVIRDGKESSIAVNEVVLDDLMKVKTGYQIIADATVVDGSVEVDESLLSGESKTIVKQDGDELFSGSFVVSGQALAVVNRVGKDNYAAQITKDARAYNRYPSELRKILDNIVKYIGITIIPIGIALFFKSFVIQGNPFDETVLTVTAALIGMIPEGLVILTSVSLAIGAINLTRKDVLVQELYCIESLARVDVLCLDKTGTITEGVMEVEELINYGDQATCEGIIANLLNALNDDNATIEAIRSKYPARNDYTLINAIPFSSQRKYSGAVFKEGTYLFGAYNFIFKETDAQIQEQINQYATQGKRLICLASLKDIDENGAIEPTLLGLIVIVDKIRAQAKDTLAFFASQGVDIRIISGDDPVTVSEVAHRAGVNGYDKAIDASQLQASDIAQAAKDYKVFGRVSPQQKKALVLALKAEGHSVGMTGDGVNDVLAFKEADVSVAMNSGSDVAKNSANLVLMKSNFDALPYALNEGRRVINNIQRVATLFLTKTIYSCALSVLLIFLPYSYPFVPIHLTFVSAFLIGIPGFVIALEPNFNRVTQRFIDNVIKIALPGAIGVVLAMNYLLAVSKNLGVSTREVSSMSVIILIIGGLFVLYAVCKPFSKLRIALYITMCVCIVIGVIFFHNLLMLYPVELPILLFHLPVLLALVGGSYALFNKIFSMIHH